MPGTCQDPVPGRQYHLAGPAAADLEATVVPGVVTDVQEPGRVIDLGPQGGIGVTTGAGCWIEVVQMEGKKAMPAAAFVRGQRQMVGAVLGGEYGRTSA